MVVLVLFYDRMVQANCQHLKRYFLSIRKDSKKCKSFGACLGSCQAVSFRDAGARHQTFSHHLPLKAIHLLYQFHKPILLVGNKGIGLDDKNDLCLGSSLFYQVYNLLLQFVKKLAIIGLCPCAFI